MIVRRANERGYADHGWLKSHHTFSFADYYDRRFMGFRSLRVINEDWVQPGRGFGTHPHQDMEIITYVLDGEVAHKDSMGSKGVIRPGEVQRMTAGTGVTHSEFNGSDERALHLLQIWILPAERGLAPSYEQKAFPEAERRGALRVVASQGGRDGSVTIHQDATVYASLLEAEEKVAFDLAPGRGAWVQVARGEVAIGDTNLAAGDAAAMVEPGRIEIIARDSSELLVFDLA